MSNPPSTVQLQPRQFRPPHPTATTPPQNPAAGRSTPTQSWRRATPGTTRTPSQSRVCLAFSPLFEPVRRHLGSPPALPCFVELPPSLICTEDRLNCSDQGPQLGQARFLFERRRRATAGQPITVVVFSELWVN